MNTPTALLLKELLFKIITSGSIIIIGIALLCSFEPKQPKDPAEHHQFANIQQYTHNHHNYIYFIKTHSSGGNAGIVHDPDCPCQQE